MDIYNKKYIMKKIVRLTENDLMRIVKRVISEQSSVIKTHADSRLVDKVFNDIKVAMEGLGTDEDAILKSLRKLSPNTSGAGWEANLAQKRKDYAYLLQLIKKEGFNTLEDWLKTDLSYRHANPDPLGMSKSWANDLEVLKYARKLEDLLSGNTRTF